MNNEKLKKIIRDAAQAKDIGGVMELTTLCDLSYERVRKVWGGDVSTKMVDVVHVADVLGLEIKFVSRGEA